MTLDCQKIFTNSKLTLETEYPTQSYEQDFKLNIYGTSLTTSLKMTSLKVNEENNIKLQVTPLTKSDTNLIVYFPNFLSAQLKNLQATNQSQSVIELTQNNTKKTYTLQFNSNTKLYFFEYIIDSSTMTSTLVLSLNTVTNPSTN